MMGTKSFKKQGRSINFNGSLLIILIVLLVVIGIANSNFFKPNYIINVMIKNVMEIGLIALPMTLLVIAGCIDFSVGSIMILSAIAGGLAADAYGSSIIGALVALAVGAGCGLLNGLIVTKMRLSPIVATFASMFLYSGIGRGITAGDSVYSYDFTSFIGNETIASVPIPIVIYAVFAVIFCIVLIKTRYGRSIYATGLNENATKYSGIDVDKMKMIIFLASGLCCAVAGFFYLGRFTSVKYNADTMLNLKVITIIVLGGISVVGGVGDVRGTIIATFIIGALNSGLTVLNIPIDVQTIIHGSVLIISLIVYAIIIEKEKKERVIDIKDDNI